MKILRAIYLLTTILLLNTLSAQGTLDIKVKKPCTVQADFTYCNQPIHPKALFDLNGSDTVDLRSYAGNKNFYDMSRAQSWIKWPTTIQKQRSYGCLFLDTTNGSYVNWDMWYVPLGQLPDCRFVVLWHCYGGSHLNYTYVMTVSLRENFLIKHWDYISIPCDYISCDMDKPIELKGNEIINAGKRYPIPPLKY